MKRNPKVFYFREMVSLCLAFVLLSLNRAKIDAISTKTTVDRRLLAQCLNEADMRVNPSTSFLKPGPQVLVISIWAFIICVFFGKFL